MSRGLFGAALGASAATAYYRPDVVTDVLRDSALAGLNFSKGTSSATSRELDQIHKLIEQLARDVKSAKQPVAIFHTGGDRGTSIFVYTVAAAGVGTVVYLTVFRGWRLADLLYVTRRSLREGLATVSQGLDALGVRVHDIRVKLQARMAELARKQDDTIAAQAALKAQLAGVGADVESTRSQVGQIHGLVLDMEAGLTEVGANQRHANHGIYILCKAVGELMQGSNIAAQAELLHYTQHPIWQGERLQGLEGLLPSDEGERQNGLLLQSGAPYTAAAGAAPPHLACVADGSRGAVPSSSGQQSSATGSTTPSLAAREESPAKRPERPASGFFTSAAMPVATGGQRSLGAVRNAWFQ